MGVVELAFLLEHHLQLLPLQLHVVLLDILASEGIMELVEVLLSSDDLVLPALDVRSPDVQQLIDEEILRLFLVPAVSLPPKLLLDQPDKELVEVWLIGPRDHFVPEGTVKLCDEGAVVGDDVDCAVDRLSIVNVLL